MRCARGDRDGPGCGFSTVWSRLPQHSPILAVWAGGDAVLRLYENFADPIAAAAEALDETLYFAGEAASPGYAGTVAGAIETGQRAALEAGTP